MQLSNSSLGWFMPNTTTPYTRYNKACSAYHMLWIYMHTQYIYIYIYIHYYMHACMHAYMHTYKHIYIYIIITRRSKWYMISHHASFIHAVGICFFTWLLYNYVISRQAKLICIPRNVAWCFVLAYYWIWDVIELVSRQLFAVVC